MARARPRLEATEERNVPVRREAPEKILEFVKGVTVTREKGGRLNVKIGGGKRERNVHEPN